MREVTKDQVKAAFARRLSALKGSTVFREDRPFYTRRPCDNLLPGVTEEDFVGDLRAGDGDELVEKANVPAKFCAAYSSSALAINTLTPLRRDPTRIVFSQMGELTLARFEAKCENGLIGTNPNLDFLAQGVASAFAIESKCLELFDAKRGFSPQYEQAMSQHAEARWLQIYESLRVSPNRFKHLDAVQLVKHYLGLKRTHADSGRKVVLLYVFWEPRNVSEFVNYSRHREEVEELSNTLAGSTIAFEARSYARLWEEWESRCLPLEHVQRLRERYDFDV